MDTDSVSDLSYLNEIAMGDQSIVIEVTETFLSDAPNALKEIKKHSRDRNWSALAKVAHKVKPNFKYMGMDRASEIIVDIEQQAKSEDISADLDHQIDELVQLSDQAFDELASKLESLKKNN
ncbi:Hpt domain-containing protein [Fodinibius sp. Rm-B-1B1-1]|uniref:Hpt domain-containing protein n=1 Tax=Fodinibius alkaliphilus TaxID=3140241 RepID=UPI00315B04DC